MYRSNFQQYRHKLPSHLKGKPPGTDRERGLPLQRQNAEILTQIFPEKEYRGLSPNFHIHASVCDLYIPTIGLPFLLEEICRPLLEDYINHSQTHECGNWGWGRAIPGKGLHKWDFRCSVSTINERNCRETIEVNKTVKHVFFTWIYTAWTVNFLLLTRKTLMSLSLYITCPIRLFITDCYGLCFHLCDWCAILPSPSG